MENRVGNFLLSLTFVIRHNADFFVYLSLITKRICFCFIIFHLSKNNHLFNVDNRWNKACFLSFSSLIKEIFQIFFMEKNWTREFRNSESASRQFLRVSKKNIWVGRFLAQSVGLPQTKIILRMALLTTNFIQMCLSQCCKWTVAHSLNSTWIRCERPENRLNCLMVYRVY